MRIASSIFRRIDPDTLEIAGARNGAREHGGYFVAGGELLELGLERVGCNERRARSWRVVGWQRSRRARCGAAGRLEGTSQHACKVSDLDAPGAQQDRGALDKRNDGRLDADLARTAIENQRHRAAEIAGDMRCCCR